MDDKVRIFITTRRKFFRINRGRRPLLDSDPEEKNCQKYTPTKLHRNLSRKTAILAGNNDCPLEELYLLHFEMRSAKQLIHSEAGGFHLNSTSNKSRPIVKSLKSGGLGII
ncbi:hypothetical protein AVEN_10671-1 [Araneus ventricosus]|uniref:Uncharacterized protein n=1 Tax=Araneus ventricosus TaxID=182803 RepID=A0A4Y2EVY3_ARAVE|nr:hypothetical protein AVEN_10671-1 [Araneus ventricosus]